MTEPARKLGILGGTFNPIHLGHLRAAEECRDALGLDRVLIIPAGTPPLKSTGLASAQDRLKMASIAVEGRAALEVLAIEAEREGKSFTVDTLRQLKAMYPAAELHFIIGVDAFMELHLWMEAEALFTLARFVIIRRPPSRFESLIESRYLKHSPGFADELRRMDGSQGPDTFEPEPSIAGAMGVTLLRTTPVGISATEIRRLMRAGLSITSLLPPQVESFIMTNGLYTDNDETRGEHGGQCPRVR